MSDREFGEKFKGYRAQGYSFDESQEKANRYLYNRKRYEYQKKIRDAINQLKVSDPKRYAKLVYRAAHEEEIAAKEREEQRLGYEEQIRPRKARRLAFERSLVVTGIPNVASLLRDVEGLVAFRAWDIRPNGKLASTVRYLVWNSVAIADKMPTADNNNGIYCVKLSPFGLMTKASCYLSNVCGLLELRGKVLEHTDGIVRAEWARIMCVFIRANENTESIYQGLYQNYPTVPLYVLHEEQIAEVLLRVTVMQSMGEVNNGC